MISKRLVNILSDKLEKVDFEEGGGKKRAKGQEIFCCQPTTPEKREKQIYTSGSYDAVHTSLARRQRH